MHRIMSRANHLSHKFRTNRLHPSSLHSHQYSKFNHLSIHHTSTTTTIRTFTRNFTDRKSGVNYYTQNTTNLKKNNSKYFYKYSPSPSQPKNPNQPNPQHNPSTLKTIFPNHVSFIQKQSPKACNLPPKQRL